MKNPDRDTISKITELPNIGKAMACDLRAIGINHPKDLIGKNPLTLYKALCFKTGNRHDPCVMDVFMSIVDFMEGGKPRAWWFFTPERKKYYHPARQLKEEDKLGRVLLIQAFVNVICFSQVEKTRPKQKKNVWVIKDRGSSL